MLWGFIVGMVLWIWVGALGFTARGGVGHGGKALGFWVLGGLRLRVSVFVGS